MISFLKRLFGRESLTFTSAGRTDTGRVRANNEDSFSILADRQVFVVADGMGGHQAGEVASRVAIETLIEVMAPAALHRMRGNPEEIQHFLISSLHRANERVIAMAAADEHLKGMGCTLVAALVDGRTLHTCHVGDARCYVAHAEELEQVTVDHSMVVERARSGGGGDDTGPQPSRHVVTRAIGFPFSEDPEYHCRRLDAGDRLLLCSDGLWSMVAEEELHRLLAVAATPEEASDRLVQAANEAGGRDNITVVAVFVDPP